MDIFIGKLIIIPGILIGLVFHEFAHAFAADRLGDPTPRSQGRLTIEPWPHIDIIGFICLMVFRFGWGKPVQIDPRNFKRPRRDEIIVSLAGPFINFIMAIIFGLIVYILNLLKIENVLSRDAVGILYFILYLVIYYNVLLGIFNLLPIPPLDGSKVLANLLPFNLRQKYLELQIYSLFILLILIYTKAFSIILGVPIRAVYLFILNVFGLPDILQI
jgi:Zn-dependent protease